jgi:hypothetical protein
MARLRELAIAIQIAGSAYHICVITWCAVARPQGYSLFQSESIASKARGDAR